MGLNDLIKIGDRIKTYRKNLNLTQAEMADKLHIPRSTYANYESNSREPNSEIIDKIAEILGVSKFDLLYDVDKIKSELEILDKHAENIEKNQMKNTQDFEKLYEQINAILDEFNYTSTSDDRFNAIDEDLITIKNKYEEDIVTVEKSKYVDLGKNVFNDIEKYREMRILYFLEELRSEK